MSYAISAGLERALREFRLPAQLGFGAVAAPAMFSAQWVGGSWDEGELLPYGPIEIFPGARALQYAELVFEGMKAYRIGLAPILFRPRENWLRMARSAERLAMPVVPEALFFQAIEAVVRTCQDFIPRESGRALYLRPCLFGTEPGYVLRNSSTFRFMVIANPVEAYAAGSMRVAIERQDVRAAVGGVGGAKAAANYAPSLRASSAAMARGLTVALWLDAKEQRFIQELSGMNVFAIIDGELHTPPLDGAILPGITRDSLLKLAPQLGFVVHERPMALDELLSQIRSGQCSEVFSCGTAAIVSPISLLADRDGQEYSPKQTNVVAMQLREALLAIQEQRSADIFGWTHALATPA
jgi:branched-chain amino acid aminotransferase